MRTTAIRACPAIALALAMACADDSGKPPAGPTLWSDNGLTVTRLEITGPASVPQGQSAQYSALAHLSDGSTRAPKSVKWLSSQSALFRVDQNGVVTATQVRGEAALLIEASVLHGRPVVRAARDLLVMPDGTFRLLGTVTEAGAVGVAIGGVRIEALVGEDGPVATFATTGPDGRYKLYGVPADSHLRASKEGYVSTTNHLRLGAHDIRNIELAIDGGRAAVAGDYTMTVEASTCNNNRPLPADLRRRTYDATITQNGPHLDVQLTAPAFALDAQGRGNKFRGSASGTQARLTMQDFGWPYYSPTAPSHPDIAEQLPDGTTLVLAGAVDLSRTADGWSGNMNGYLAQYRGGAFPNVVYLGDCVATRLTLSRR